MNVTITAKTLIAGHVEHDFDAAPPMELWLDQQTDARPSGPLTQLAPGPWRSLGRHLDYTTWADRDRFVELDRAIEANAMMEENEEPCEEPMTWSATFEATSAPSPFSQWGLRPIGGGHFRSSQRRRVIQ
ncbi:MAG TPA: hypothetical protein VK789_29740 [Bryobacteraceae bacterium]|nr:hypothetical protein [Bryobacteraceae bacterium]